MECGPNKPASYIGKVVALLYARYRAGQLPIAMVSMDNCSHNGDKLRSAVQAFAKSWASAGLVEKGFEEYLNDPKKVSFPWTMIDKITPRPDPSIHDILEKDGVEDLEQVVTGKNTYVAPFVNAEECEYLVIEDAFPNGRPRLEKGGFLFTDRATVDKVEKMKVCTCLNPLHTALAVFGCLLGYTLISKEMENPLLRNWLRESAIKKGCRLLLILDFESEGIYRSGIKCADTKSLYAGYTAADCYGYISKAGDSVWRNDQSLRGLKNKKSFGFKTDSSCVCRLDSLFDGGGR